MLSPTDTIQFFSKCSQFRDPLAPGDYFSWWIFSSRRLLLLMNFMFSAGMNSTTVSSVWHRPRPVYVLRVALLCDANQHLFISNPQSVNLLPVSIMPQRQVFCIPLVMSTKPDSCFVIKTTTLIWPCDVTALRRSLIKISFTSRRSQDSSSHLTMRLRRIETQQSLYNLLTWSRVYTVLKRVA